MVRRPQEADDDPDDSRAVVRILLRVLKRGEGSNPRGFWSPTLLPVVDSMTSLSLAGSGSPPPHHTVLQRALAFHAAL